MSQIEGSKQQSKIIAPPDTVLFSTEEKIQFLAELIVSRVEEDRLSGESLLNSLIECSDVSE